MKGTGIRWDRFMFWLCDFLIYDLGQALPSTNLSVLILNGGDTSLQLLG